MEPMIVWTDADFTEQGAERDFALDLACGIGDDPENDFVLELPDDVRIAANSAVFVDGTPWGGVVYGRTSDTSTPGTLQWSGRTWQGVWGDRILFTSSGDGYVTSSGTVAACISSLVSTLGLSWLFDVGDCPDATISYRHTRHPDGWTALWRMLASANLRPTFAVDRKGGTVRVLVGAVEPTEHEELADSELADFALDRTFTPYNHVIALGKGEGTARDVVHRYADASGNVSSTQSLTGPKERVLLDDYPNAEHDDLVEHAEDLLKDAQAASAVDIQLAADADVALGDTVSAYDQRVDERVTTTVSKAVLKVQNGISTVAWEAAE